MPSRQCATEQDIVGWKFFMVREVINMTAFEIKHELRPCYIAIKRGKKEKGLFHGWNFISNVIEPSIMIGGHPGGVVSYCTGIVELEDGRIVEGLPTNITFVKGKFNDYSWNEEE